MNSYDVFIHIHQGCFAGTGVIVRWPQCQWSKPDGYGKISQCITTTKHSKAKTVCTFLGIYCNKPIYQNVILWIHSMSDSNWSQPSIPIAHNKSINQNDIYTLCVMNLQSDRGTTLQTIRYHWMDTGHCDSIMLATIYPLEYVHNFVVVGFGYIYIYRWCMFLVYPYPSRPLLNM